MRVLHKSVLIILVLFLVAGTAQASALIPANRVSAPSLFGTADLVTYMASLTTHHFTGTINNGTVRFQIDGNVGGVTGQSVNGYLLQVKGLRPLNWACDGCPTYRGGKIPFKAWLGRGDFKGKIYFRGEWRAFCGGIDEVPAPNQCLLKPPKPQE
jgi:hypothetical protein